MHAVLALIIEILKPHEYRALLAFLSQTPATCSTVCSPCSIIRTFQNSSWYWLVLLSSSLQELWKNERSVDLRIKCAETHGSASIFKTAIMLSMYYDRNDLYSYFSIISGSLHAVEIFGKNQAHLCIFILLPPKLVGLHKIRKFQIVNRALKNYLFYNYVKRYRFFFSNTKTRRALRIYTTVQLQLIDFCAVPVYCHVFVVPFLHRYLLIHRDLCARLDSLTPRSSSCHLGAENRKN